MISTDYNILQLQLSFLRKQYNVNERIEKLCLYMVIYFTPFRQKVLVST